MSRHLSLPTLLYTRYSVNPLVGKFGKINSSKRISAHNLWKINTQKLLFYAIENRDVTGVASVPSLSIKHFKLYFQLKIKYIFFYFNVSTACSWLSSNKFGLLVLFLVFFVLRNNSVIVVKIDDCRAGHGFKSHFWKYSYFVALPIT